MSNILSSIWGKGFRKVMPLIRRIYHISCHGEECYKLAEFIRENINVPEISISFREHGIYIELYGYKSDIRNAWNKIKHLLSMYKKSMVRTKKGYRIPIDYIVSRIRKTFPPVLLAEILRKMGYGVRCEGNFIETDIEPEELLELADKIADTIQAIRYKVGGTAAKYLVVAASILTNRSAKDIDMTINELVELGYLYIDEDGKARLKLEWRKALDMYLRGKTL